MSMARRLACLMGLAAVALALPATASAAGPDYRIFVFTPRGDDAKTAAAVKAVREIGRDGGFSVVASPDPGLFTADSLARFRAVVFLNTAPGDVLD